NNFSNTIGSGLTTTYLTVQGGTVSTAGGILTLGGGTLPTTTADVVSEFNSSNQTAATISGNLALGSGGTAVTRTFDIQHNSISLPIDMVISAVISNGTTVPSNLTQDLHNGILQLTANNL